MTCLFSGSISSTLVGRLYSLNIFLFILVKNFLQVLRKDGGFRLWSNMLMSLKQPTIFLPVNLLSSDLTLNAKHSYFIDQNVYKN